MTRRDPVLAEVRRIRDTIARECGHDLDRIAERLTREAAQARLPKPKPKTTGKTKKSVKRSRRAA
jgi:hypothetical protein